MDEAYALAEEQKKKVDPMYYEKIDRLVDKYAYKLAEVLNKGYAIDARVPSILIAGYVPQNKKDRQNKARQQNYDTLKNVAKYLDDIKKIGRGGISSDDRNAIQKLEKKLQDCIDLQDKMKAINKYYKKNGTLEGCKNLSEELRKELEGTSIVVAPFRRFELQNNNAEIHRLKERIAILKDKEEAQLPSWYFDGGYVKSNKELNRLQILFDDVPDANIRSDLKRNGFRWSPKLKAWQRQLNINAYYAADRIDAIKHISGVSVIGLYKDAISNQKKNDAIKLER